MKFRFYKVYLIDLLFLGLITIFYFIKDTKDAAFIFESTSVLTSKNPEFLFPLLITSPFRLFLSGLGYTLFNSFAYLMFINLLIRRSLIASKSKILLLFYPTIFYWLGQTLKDGFNVTIILWLSFYFCILIYNASTKYYGYLIFKIRQLIAISPFILLLSFAFLIRPLQYIALSISFVLAFAFKDSNRIISLSPKIPRKNLFIPFLMIALGFFLAFKSSSYLGIDINMQLLEVNVKNFLYSRLTRNDIGSADGSGSDLFNPPELILTQPLIYTLSMQLISFVFGPITLLVNGKIKLVYILTAICSSFSAVVFLKTVFFMPTPPYINNEKNFSFLYYKILFFMTIISWLSLPVFLNNAGNLFRYSVYPVSIILLLYSVKKQINNDITVS